MTPLAKWNIDDHLLSDNTQKLNDKPITTSITYVLLLCTTNKIQGYYFSSFGFPSILLAAVTLLLFLLLTCFISNQQQQGWWLAPNHFPWVLPPLAPPPLPPGRRHYIQNEHTAFLPFFVPPRKLRLADSPKQAKLLKYSQPRVFEALVDIFRGLLPGRRTLGAGQKGWP